MSKELIDRKAVADNIRHQIQQREASIEMMRNVVSGLRFALDEVERVKPVPQAPLGKVGGSVPVAWGCADAMLEATKAKEAAHEERKAAQIAELEAATKRGGVGKLAGMQP